MTAIAVAVSRDGYTMIRLRMHMNLSGQLGTGINLLQLPASATPRAC